jgi:hypothetical protein
MTQEYEKIRESLIEMEKQTSITILEELIHGQDKPHIFRLLISSGKYINSNSEELLKLAIEKTKSGSKISLEFVKILLFYNHYEFDLNKYAKEDIIHLFFLNKNFDLPDEIFDKDDIDLFKKFPNIKESFLTRAVDSKSVKILDFLLTRKDYHAPLGILENYCEATDNHDMFTFLQKYF